MAKANGKNQWQWQWQWPALAQSLFKLQLYNTQESSWKCWAVIQYHLILVEWDDPHMPQSADARRASRFFCLFRSLALVWKILHCFACRFAGNFLLFIKALNLSDETLNLSDRRALNLSDGVWVVIRRFEFSLNDHRVFLKSFSALAHVNSLSNKIKSPSNKFKPRSIRQSHISIDKVKSTPKKFKVSWMKLLICWMDIWLCRWRFDFVGWSEVWICRREIWLCWWRHKQGLSNTLRKTRWSLRGNLNLRMTTQTPSDKFKVSSDKLLCQRKSRGFS